MIAYELRRSKRKTLSLQITSEAKIVVHAPLKMPTNHIEEFILSHEGWIHEHLSKQQARKAFRDISEEEKTILQQQARQILPQKVAYYSQTMRLVPTAIKINGAEHRFGSCNEKNCLHFSWWLMLYPEPAIDYVVVHELAHIKYKNHSADFYHLIERYLPDYRERWAMLKK